jgi:hypothetical protein
MRAQTASLTIARSRSATAALGMLAAALVLLVAGPWLTAAHAAASSQPAPSPAGITINKSVPPNVVEFGKDVTIARGDAADAVVIFGGKVDVAGTVTHMIIAIGGDVTLEPTAVVGTRLASSDTALVIVGGHLTRDAGAKVTGKRFDWGHTRFGKWHWNFGFLLAPHWFFFGPISWLAQTVMDMVLALIFVALFPRQVGAVKDHLRHSPLAAFGWGLLIALVMVPVASVLLVITIVGIFALIPGLVFVLPIILLFGMVGTAALVGETVLGAFNKRSQTLLVSAVLGAAILNLLHLVPIAGIIAIVLLLVAGFGAAWLAIFDWQRGRGGGKPEVAPAAGSPAVAPAVAVAPASEAQTGAQPPARPPA